jgi:hypothetical protein
MKVIKLNPNNEEIKWKKVFSTQKPIQAEILAASLENEGINVVKINKQDSSYTVFGEIELYVPEDEYALAVTLISAGNY